MSFPYVAFFSFVCHSHSLFLFFFLNRYYQIYFIFLSPACPTSSSFRYQRCQVFHRILIFGKYNQVPCETEVPCSFFSVRDERNLCSQPHDFLSCMRELRQHLSRETPLPVFESKRHFLLFRGNSLRQLRSKKTSLCRQLLFLRRMCRLKLPQKPID